MKGLTNTELMTRMMEVSPYGAMAQIVIMNALDKHFQDAIGDKEQHLKGYHDSIAEGKHPFINMEAYIATCEDIKRQMDENTELNNAPMEYDQNGEAI